MTDSLDISTSDILSYLSSDTPLASLVKRLELTHSLIRRHQEQLIVDLIDFDDDFLQSESNKTLADISLESFLQDKGWSELDFKYHVLRPHALLRFAEHRFGPGLEEQFLSAKGGHDQVIYSLLRVKDYGLAQELWIRLEEGEASFADLATSFGEGSESARKGLIGPLPIGSINTQDVTAILRSLQPGHVYPPTKFGDWVVLIRLESLLPARFDDSMRSFLLNQKLDAFLDGRVESILQGQAPESIRLDP